jgi:HK97 family phage major capsid protein
VSSAGASAEWVAEAAEVADGGSTLAQPSVVPYKYDCFVPYSVEVGEDALNFEGEITRVMADAVDQLQATAFTTGSGSGQPTGIITALTATASVVTGTTATSAEVVSVQNALPPRFQPRDVLGRRADGRVTLHPVQARTTAEASAVGAVDAMRSGDHKAEVIEVHRR